MTTLQIDDAPSYADIAWTPFAGGELEGTRTTALCPACRAARRAGQPAANGVGTLCFQCYRTELERSRKAQAAVELDTASEERFQTQLPFEPVNTARLAQLRHERQTSRERAHHGVGAYVEKRRRAQIEARHALARILKGLKRREMAVAPVVAHRAAAARMEGASALRMPDSWLPFVVSR
jgi:hypothetical protein